MSDPVAQFHDALQSVFGSLEFLPIPDGEINRFHVPGDRSGSENGWYVLYLDGIASGAFGSWKTGLSSTWSSRRPANHLEAQLIAQRIEQARRQREAEQHRRQQETAVKAVGLWRSAVSANPDHPYLIAKGIQPHSLRQHGDVLLVPLYLNRVLVNLQCLYSDGAKRFLSGGRVKGCYSPISSLEDGGLLYVCEGWATGATIHEETGAAVACAINAGNLFAVGDRLRRAYPDSPLIVAGDDDRMTEGNPGRTAAERAAADLGALGVVFPPWSGEEPLELSDFNDLRQWVSKQ